VPYGGGFKVPGTDEKAGGVFIGASLLALVKMAIAGWGITVRSVA